MKKEKEIPAPQGVKFDPNEPEKGKRGRKPLTDEQRAEREEQKKNSLYKFRAGQFLAAAYGFEIEGIKRSHDNSQAVTFVVADKGSFLLVEDGNEIAVFTNPKRCERNPHKMLALLQAENLLD